ncbi:hypothetical protein HanRHA438_Chr02g0055311 [Helianthus annuus]|nr:hypothetical protein HanRHA438_Chr02g0055311 [Helianthus annuus]KAJ0950846.1 hypothetical protein HanPSC8_Chr02g0053011 [Helianthus annuus]
MAWMMFQALGCCTYCFICSQERERESHPIVNPSSTLPLLRRRAGDCHRQYLNHNSGNGKKGFEGSAPI